MLMALLFCILVLLINWQLRIMVQTDPPPTEEAVAAMERAEWQRALLEKSAQDSDVVLIIISKETLRLHAISYNGRLINSYPVAVGRGYGKKRRIGDLTTPQGYFHIASITNARGAGHDFHDGRGVVRGAYGPWFMRIDVPGYPHIGIHGNCNRRSIGTRASLGCVRMHNDQISDLRSRVRVGVPVFIMGGRADYERDKDREPVPVITSEMAAKAEKEKREAEEKIRKAAGDSLPVNH